MAFNSQMHERNIYKNRPDFAQIALNYPEFRKYALSDAKGKVRVDFTDPSALRILTKILLKKDFNLSVEIPKGFLIPTIPQRLNYILWIEDLLSILTNKSKILRGIDIGCGPCAIFSILGAKKNGWMFTSTETSQEALQWALNNIKANDLGSLIKVVKVSSNSVLSEVLSSNEDHYDFCLCNPPFFENMDDIRKKPPRVKETITTIVKQEEIFAEGGEVAFVKRIIEESLIFKNRVKLYTSMFGKKKSFVEIFKCLQDIEGIMVTKSQFCQGNTIRWGVAWTFDKSVNFRMTEKPKSKKTKKVKPPLVHQIPKDVKCSDYNVQQLSKIVWNTLKDLEIQIKVARVHEHYTESQITTDRNTWSHQRRKRREMKRTVENTDNDLSPNKSSKDEQITANLADVNPTTSISVTKASIGQISETDNFPTLENKSLDHSIKKRKLDADESSDCKKPRLDLVLSEVIEPKCESISFQNVSDDNCDTNQRSSPSSPILKKEFIELVGDSKCVNSASGNTATFKSVTDASGELVDETVSKDKSFVAKIENEDLKIVTSGEALTSADRSLKKRKRNEGNSPDFKKARLNFEMSEQTKLKCELIGQCSKDISADNCDSNELNSSSSLRDPYKELMENSSDSKTVMASDALNESESVKRIQANLIKADDISDPNFAPKALLFCILKIRRAKDVVLIEMNCSDDANRESMYQIFQYLKNKLL